MRQQHSHRDGSARLVVAVLMCTALVAAVLFAFLVGGFDAWLGEGVRL